MRDPEPPRTRKKVQRRWSRVLCVTGAFVLALLAGEVLVRIFADVQLPLYTADAEIGRRYRAGFDGDVYVSEARKKVRLRFHRDGFRGPDRSYEKPEGLRRVAVIGDSMALALAVEEEYTLVEQLRALLEKSHPETDWEVLNFGASAASTGQELAVYRELAHRYEPDYVVCMVYLGNDISDNSRELSTRSRIYFEHDEDEGLRKVPLPVAQASVNRWLNQNSHLYAWQKKVTRRMRRKVEAYSDHRVPRDQLFLQEGEPAWERAWQLTRTLLHTFAEDVRADGGEFAVLLVPSAPQIYPERWAETVETAVGAEIDPLGPERRLRGFCDEGEIPFVSLTEPFRAREEAQAPASEDWLFFKRSGHMTVSGNRLGAEVLHTALFE